ncbi:uncharacterized protein LOC120417940 [Culex pipiens pallens]|uniref:uncharacterized protein LOC120417940 n=1 Tax=Culex pipiens pallens TaxID=42434 RepID=UPI00195470A2|nr:uncharacterized protein LOC120417940 [Culex pipiens pallens]
MALPDELSQKVFQNLSVYQLFQVRLTCRHWNQIVRTNDSIMDKMILHFPPETILCSDSEEFGALKSTHYNRIVLDRVTLVEPSSWWPICCENLHTLTVINCNVLLEELLRMLELSKNLKDLTVDFGDLKNVPEIKFQLKSLEKLNICGAAHPEVLKTLMDMCPKIMTLKLPYIGNTGKSSLDKEVFELCIQFILSVKNTLQDLTVQGGQEDFWRSIISTIKNIPLKRLTSPLPTIKAYKDQNTLNELNELNIEALCVTNSLFSFVINPFGKKLQMLKELEVEIDPRSIIHFDNLQELQHLKVKGDFDHPRSLSKLKSIKLINYTLYENLFEGHPNLNSIILRASKIYSLTDFFTQCATLKTLHSIELSNVSEENKSTCFFKHFPHLKCLKLSACKMSTNFLKTTFTLCPNLEEVSLVHMENVNDEVLLKLFQKSGPSLKFFITSCLTAVSVRNIAKYCDKIEKITLYGEVPVEVIKKLKFHRNVQIIHRKK